MNSNWIIIGIGGATCSGKTTVAKELNNKIPESVLIHQDDFFLPTGSPQLEFIEEVQHYNWDVLSAIDTKRFVEKIQNVMTCNERAPGILIVEGTLVLNIPEIRELCTLRYYFTTPYEVCKERRRHQFYEIPDPPENFDKIVWPQHLKYRAELNGDGECITFMDSGDNDVCDLLNTILNDLSEMTDLRRVENVSLHDSKSEKFHML